MDRIIKKKLEERRNHAFEKKVYEREIAKEIHSDFYDDYDSNSEDIDVLEARKNVAIGVDISTMPIECINQNIYVRNHYVPVRFYQSNHKKDKAIVYIHGGGFVSGSVESKDAQCKYLAQQSNATVVSIEYRLAPETMFPGALEDCLGVIDYLSNAYEKIIVGGDSAGGNLAALCMAKDTRISYGFLIYAALDLSSYKDSNWDYSFYEMEESQKEWIQNRLYRFRNLAIDMKKLYLPQGVNTKDPEVSPLYIDDCSNFPPVLMIEAEFDYYRICNEEFEKKLPNCEVIYYEGLDHGFFDRIGQLEQTKDCIDEIAKRIRGIN